MEPGKRKVELRKVAGQIVDLDTRRLNGENGLDSQIEELSKQGAALFNESAKEVAKRLNMKPKLVDHKRFQKTCFHILRFPQ